MALQEIAPLLLFELLKNATDQSIVEEQTASSSSSEQILGITNQTETDLNEKISKLALCCQAMWELLQENTNLNTGDLNRKVMEIDLRDGIRDHHMKPQPKQCPKCDSMVSAKFQRCLFCGYEDPDASPLAGI